MDATTVKVQWIGGERFVGVDSTQHAVVMSTKKDSIGMKPSDMLLVAVGACSAVDVVGILQKKRLDLRGLDIQVSGEQDAAPPWTFKKIHVMYTLRGKALTPAAVEQAIDLSQEKYCSVASTLRGAAALSHSYQIVEE